MIENLLTAYRPDMYVENRRTFVVLGAPRGGTSMLAGAMQILGVPMGSVNDQHEDPAFGEAIPTEGKLAAIKERNGCFDRWGWKLPNTIYFYRDLHEALINPVFVVIYRNPFDVFMSSCKHDGCKLSDPIFNVPAYHYARMHELINRYQAVPTYAFNYERCCARKRTFVRALAQILGTDPAGATLARARAFVSPRRGYADLTSRFACPIRFLRARKEGIIRGEAATLSDTGAPKSGSGI